MTVEEWRASLAEIVLEADKHPLEPAHIRQLIFGLWLLFRKAPVSVQVEFERLDDLSRLLSGRTCPESLCAYSNYLRLGGSPPVSAHIYSI